MEVLITESTLDLLAKCTFRFFSIHILYHAFTGLYSHKQHAYVTFVKVFAQVNDVHFFKQRIFASSPSFDKNNHYTKHMVSRSAIIFPAEICVTLVYFPQNKIKEMTFHDWLRVQFISRRRAWLLKFPFSESTVESNPESLIDKGAGQSSTPSVYTDECVLLGTGIKP